LMRHRLNDEAKRLQARYDAKKIASNARSAVFAVADFDGTASSGLGGQPEAADFHLFVFAEMENYFSNGMRCRAQRTWPRPSNRL